MKSEKKLYDEISNLVTEQRNPRSMDIDSKSTEEMLRIINDEDKTVPFAIEKEIPYIALGVDLIADAFKKGGRLIYVGAGTSGRLGVLDASEIPPTYGADPEMVQGIIAGGYKALVEAQEGAEDIEEDGARDLKAKNVSAKDVVCGIAASRRTPYVIGAVKYARSIGAKTLYVTCTPRHEMTLPVDVAICPVVGPEVVMGSTRMKAGTATKLVLNMLTTAAMIKLGKVYENMMVDLQMNSQKLIERSKRTLIIVTGVDYEAAARYLEAAEGHVKTAIVMIKAGVSKEEARKRLQMTEGNVRQAIEVNPL